MKSLTSGNLHSTVAKKKTGKVKHFLLRQVKSEILMRQLELLPLHVNWTRPFFFLSACTYIRRTAAHWHTTRNTSTIKEEVFLFASLMDEQVVGASRSTGRYRPFLAYCSAWWRLLNVVHSSGSQPFSFCFRLFKKDVANSRLVRNWRPRWNAREKTCTPRNVYWLFIFLCWGGTKLDSPCWRIRPLWCSSAPTSFPFFISFFYCPSTTSKHCIENKNATHKTKKTGNCIFLAFFFFLFLEDVLLGPKNFWLYGGLDLFIFLERCLLFLALISSCVYTFLPHRQTHMPTLLEGYSRESGPIR